METPLALTRPKSLTHPYTLRKTMESRSNAVDPESYCSAPPFVTPPRPFRQVEHTRKREPLSPLRGESRVPECSFGLESVDVKPNVPSQAANTQVNHIRSHSPPASPSSRRSSSSAQGSPEPPEDNKVPWETPALRRPTMIAAPNPRRLTSAATPASPPPRLYRPTTVCSRPTPSSALPSCACRAPRGRRKTSSGERWTAYNGCRGSGPS